MSECEYPLCSGPVLRKRCLVVEPTPIGIAVCAEHDEILERNRADEEHDFWRWANAMMQAPTRG